MSGNRKLGKATSARLAMLRAMVTFLLENCKIDASFAKFNVGDTFQFMRQGYFTVDPDSTEKNIVFNRTVALKDSFVKKA